MIIQKNVRQTREKSWLENSWKNACHQNWLMIMKKHRNDLNHFRSCETQKSESDCFTTACIPMKSIHWKCALIVRQKTFSRCDSLKWLCWNWAIHWSAFLQWLRKPIENCVRSILTERDSRTEIVSCRTRKKSIQAWMKCSSVSTVLKHNGSELKRQIISFNSCWNCTIYVRTVDEKMIYSLHVRKWKAARIEMSEHIEKNHWFEIYCRTVFKIQSDLMWFLSSSRKCLILNETDRVASLNRFKKILIRWSWK